MHLRLFKACCTLGPSLALISGSLTQASTFGPGVSQGTVTAPAITEASGVVASPNNSNVLWVENDSGHPNTIYAIDTTGKLLGSYTLGGATNNDWEDIAIGPGPVPGVNYLYLYESPGTGSTTVYRVPEPAVYATQQVGSPVTKTLSGVQSQTFSMPASGGAAVSDGEAMFVDPRSGNLYFGTKESGTTRFFEATQAQFAAAGPQVSTLVGSVFLSKGNGADISPSGNEILVRNQNQLAYLYHRGANETIGQALTHTPDFITINGKDVELNAESINYDSVGQNFFTLSEGSNQKLYEYTRTSNDGPVAPTTLVAAAATWKYLDGVNSPAAGWNQPGFNTASWASGSGPFGYGQGGEHTTLSFGGNANAKPASYEFVTTFNVTDPSVFGELTLKLLVDDGAVVYLNGVEVTRLNLAANAGSGTYATAVADALQNTWRSIAINHNLLHAGTNTLAIEVHGSSATDNDLRFDAQLVAGVPEPSTIALAGMGLAGLVWASRRRRNRQA